MSALNQLDLEEEEPLASDEQFLGEGLSSAPAEEKWPRGRAMLFAFSASLALWVIIFFAISRII